MSACPVCGVAVVPGYVKCPKCGNQLPAVARTKSTTFGGGGGTAVDEAAASGSRTPLFAALGAGVVIAIVLAVVLGGSGSSKPATAATPGSAAADEDSDEPDQPAQAQPTLTDEPPGLSTPQVAPGTSAREAAAQLDRELKRQRLWGTVTVFDSRVDVRSGSCDDKDMAPVIDAARSRLSGAGLTRLRCLSQSGAVVFERDL